MKKLSDEELKPPFDLNYNKQYKHYKEKERCTKLKQSNEFWLNKLYGSKIKYDLSLGEIFYIIQLLKKAYADCDEFADNPSMEYLKEYNQMEKVGVWRLIGKLKQGLDDNLCSDKVEEFWKEHINMPAIDVPDELYSDGEIE